MIVRNEEANLQQCLAPVEALFDEIVIVDTGSQDQTREIASRFTSRIFHFDWCDDFAAARNESLQHATGDWIFWLDADDRVSEGDVQKLQALFASLDMRWQVYMMDTVLLPSEPCEEPWLVGHPRLFRRHPKVAWRGRVHEQVQFQAAGAHYEIVPSDVRIVHTGYQDAGLCHRKQQRKLRLLRVEYAVNPADPIVNFHLGMAYAQLRNAGEARKYLLRLIGAGAPSHDVQPLGRVYSALAELSVHEGQFADALMYLEQGLAVLPYHEHLLFLKAQVHCQLAQLAAAQQALASIIRGDGRALIHGMDLGNIRQKLAPRLLADVLRMQNQFAAAEEALTPLLAAFPQDTPSWYVLGLVAIDTGDQEKLRGVLDRIQPCPFGRVYGRLLAGKWHLQRNELSAAGELIEQLVAEAPDMAFPRMLRAEWLSRNRAPVESQIQALRDILRVQPGNAEAAHWLREMEAYQQALQPAVANKLQSSVVLMPGMSVG